MLVTSIFSFSDYVFYPSRLCFLPFPIRNFVLLVKFILSSANAFNLDQSKNLLFGIKVFI